MRSYLAYIRTTLRLTARDRMVLFFGYVFPIAIFALFANSFRAEQSTGTITQVICMVLVLGVLGNGFFGGGMRATAEREAGILRRFKVAPITAAPVLVSSMVTGWVVFLPSVVLFLVIGHFKYGMPWPQNLLSIFVFLSAGIIAFRSVGLIIASVVNSMAESQVVVQLLYLPMLMLSGATIPLTILPDWLQQVAQFIPATHLFLGMQNLLVRGESLWNNLVPLGALLLTTAVSLFVSVKLFRWEKEEKVKTSAKLWILAVMLPFFLIGVWQLRSKDNLAKAKILDRDLRRSSTFLIRDTRLFLGDGSVIESGSILVRNGLIAEIYEGFGSGGQGPEGRLGRGGRQDHRPRPHRHGRPLSAGRFAARPRRVTCFPESSPSAPADSLRTCSASSSPANSSAPKSFPPDSRNLSASLCAPPASISSAGLSSNRRSPGNSSIR